MVSEHGTRDSVSLGQCPGCAVHPTKGNVGSGTRERRVPFGRRMIYDRGMISWRVRRQLTVIAILVAFAGGILFWLTARSLPAASCTDTRRNNGETDVDCGGPCTPCELKNPKPLSVFWARFGRAGEGSYDVAALVENPNQTLSSDLVRYEFVLLDQYGIIGHKEGTAYIYPGERLTIIEPNIRTSREPVSVEFVVERTAWKSAAFERPPLTVERRGHMISEEGGKKHSRAEAQIFNDGPLRYRRMEVTFVMFDDAGNLVGANRVLAEDISPNERRMVASIWPDVLPGSVARIDVTPRVNLFEADAIVRPQ